MVEKENKKITQIELTKITINKRFRELKNITPLAKSIKIIGQQEPIKVRQIDSDTEENKYELIDGNHRLEALKRLEYKTILAIIIDADDDHAKLIEIDTNLVREELTALEKADHLTEKKRIFEKLYPEFTSEELQKAKLKKGKNDSPSRNDFATKEIKSFIKNTAEILDKSERHIQQLIQISNNLSNKTKARVKDCKIDNIFTDLLKLSQISHEEQDKILDLIEKETVKNVKAAIKLTKEVNSTEPDANYDESVQTDKNDTIEPDSVSTQPKENDPVETDTKLDQLNKEDSAEPDVKSDENSNQPNKEVPTKPNTQNTKNSSHSNKDDTIKPEDGSVQGDEDDPTESDANSDYICDCVNLQKALEELHSQNESLKDELEEKNKQIQKLEKEAERLKQKLNNTQDKKTSAESLLTADQINLIKSKIESYTEELNDEGRLVKPIPTEKREGTKNVPRHSVVTCGIEFPLPPNCSKPGYDQKVGELKVKAINFAIDQMKLEFEKLSAN